DFVVRENVHITKAYQVTTSLADTDTIQGEINGLVAAMDAFDLKEGVIITLDETEELTLDKGRKIYVIPFYRWVFEEK
ncbi:MAG: ATP-binding protein, partial [Bacteroidales bacterium]|nr:ATP-binding protein [Bacteroidales bacterium]